MSHDESMKHIYATDNGKFLKRFLGEKSNKYLLYYCSVAFPTRFNTSESAKAKFEISGVWSKRHLGAFWINFLLSQNNGKTNNKFTVDVSLK